MWAEVSSSAPHLLHNTLSDSPVRWKCLLRVLCPVRRPVTALDCALLKDRNLALAPRQGPEINSRACLWVSPGPRHHIQCWLISQHLILLCISCLRIPKAIPDPTNFKTEPSLATRLQSHYLVPQHVRKSLSFSNILCIQGVTGGTDQTSGGRSLC
jgi:hypothetical protein